MSGRSVTDPYERKIAIALQFPDGLKVTYTGWRIDEDVPALLVKFTGEGQPPEQLNVCGHVLVRTHWTHRSRGPEYARGAEYEVAVDV